MKARKITLQNFRSFGPVPTIIDLRPDLTGIVGANSAGKTAFLEAFRRMFGLSSQERLFKRTDFHMPMGTDPSEVEKANLSIEILFDFEEDGEDAAVPELFEDMIVNDTGQPPHIRVRLEADWEKDPRNAEGNIMPKLFFITGSDENGEPMTKDFHPRKRSLVQSYYVPAIRKPSEQLKYASGSVLFRLLQRIDWTDDFKDKLKKGLEALNQEFNGVENFEKIKDSLSELWKTYNKDDRYSNAKIAFGSSDFDSILKRLEVEFTPTDIDRPYGITELGEGYRSLFYLTLVSALLKIEEELEVEVDEKPILTLLLIEEPENHIAPHLLGRVLTNLKALSKQKNVQVVITSHTPAIIGRIDPEGIRHFRMDKDAHCTISNKILLPEAAEEAHKFIKEAVRNFPEIYFSKFVVLGEGDSEEVLFKRISRAHGRDLDDELISFVPLGGRYVNHMWKLLNQLQIPHVTLLDLDLERGGGGWGRIKYILEQLILNEPELKDELLELNDGKILSDKKFSGMHNWKIGDGETLKGWISMLEDYNVFYSEPLDLDFMMLTHFEDDYKQIGDRGPNIPDKNKEPEKYEARVTSGIHATLKSNEAKASTYSNEEKELMIWYSYLFLGRSKPTTHMMALLNVEDEELLDKMPDVLKKMFENMSNRIA